MPLTDSIHLATDSTTAVADSLIKNDSIQLNADTVTLTDTIKVVTGFEGTPHPSLPESEDWVFVSLLILFVFLVLAVAKSSEWMRESVRTFFHTKERSVYSNKNTNLQFQTKLLLTIFFTGVFSLYAFSLLFGAENGFKLLIYVKFFAVTLAFLSLKSIVTMILGYVFLDKAALKQARESYFHVLSFLGITLYPILAIQIYILPTLKTYTHYVALALCTIAAILIIIKLFQIFFHKSIVSFYLMLYLCTLEILPLIILFQVYRLLI